MVRPVLLYVLADPRDRSIRYAGVTRTPLRVRLNAHLHHARTLTRTSHAQRWLNALAADGVRPLIIEVGRTDENRWRKDERALIAGLRWMGARLTNTHRGGGSGPGALTADAQQRRQEALKPRRQLPWYSEDGLARVREAAAQRVISDETRAKIAAAARARGGFPKPYDWTGRKQSPEHVARKAEARRAYYAARRVPKFCLDCSTSIDQRSTRCHPCASVRNLPKAKVAS